MAHVESMTKDPKQEKQGNLLHDPESSLWVLCTHFLIRELFFFFLPFTVLFIHCTFEKDSLKIGTMLWYTVCK